MPQNAEIQDIVPAPQALIQPEKPSGYRERLNHWAIARLMPQTSPIIIARFRTRSDADGHLRLLRQQISTDSFAVIFDPHSSSDISL